MLSESQNNTENHQFEPEETHMDVLEPVTTHYIDIDISPTLNVTSTGRPRRNYRLPRRFDDFLPEPSSPDETDDRIGFVRRVNLIVRDSFTTAANTFGTNRKCAVIWTNLKSAVTARGDQSKIKGVQTPFSNKRHARCSSSDIEMGVCKWIKRRQSRWAPSER